MVQEARPLKTRVPVLAKYEVKEEIGHGGMATVWRARDVRLGREVAVKIIHRWLRENPEMDARFVTEARAVAKLRHPNIVEVYVGQLRRRVDQPIGRQAVQTVRLVGYRLDPEGG